MVGFIVLRVCYFFVSLLLGLSLWCNQKKKGYGFTIGISGEWCVFRIEGH